MSKIPTTYDAIIQRVAQGIPVQFIKSLIWHESGMDPTARPLNSKKQPISSATGLGQVLGMVVDDFNKANGYKFTLKDMEDPEKNLMVTTWLIKTIIKVYKQNTQLKENWDDPNWVGLLYLGYGAGFSSKQGVAYLVNYMEKNGIPPSQITPETVRLLAMKLFPSSKYYNNGGGYMSEPLLMTSINNKTRDYFALRGMPTPAPWKAPPMYTPASSTPAPATSSPAPAPSTNSPRPSPAPQWPAPPAPVPTTPAESFWSKAWKPLAGIAAVVTVAVVASKASAPRRARAA